MQFAALLRRRLLVREARRSAGDSDRTATRRATSRSPRNSGSAFKIVTVQPVVVPAGRRSDGQRRVQRRQVDAGAVARLRPGDAHRRDRPGAVVTRGQPLAYVSSPDFATAVADYRKAQTAFRNAKRIADRDSALFKNDALARGDLEQAQADVAVGRSRSRRRVQNMRALGVDESQIQAVRDGKTTAIEAIIRAPIDGTVVEKLIADGQLLQAGTTPCVHDRRSEHHVGDGERLRQ